MLILRNEYEIDNPSSPLPLKPYLFPTFFKVMLKLKFKDLFNN
jgi:hypothetical protein